MAVFELDSPLRALREAFGHALPGKTALIAAGGVVAAGGVSLGLAMSVGSGIDDPAPYPNAKAAPAPVSELYVAALIERHSRFVFPVFPSDGQNQAAGSQLAVTADFLAPFEPVRATTGLAIPASDAVGPVAAPAVLIVPQVSATVPVAGSRPALAPAIQPAVVATAQPTAAPTAAATAAPEPTVASAPVVAAAPAGPGFYLPASVGSDAGLESRLLAGINAERANVGLPAFTSDGTLVRIARTRSQQMVDEGYFGHTDAKGLYMYTALLGYYGVGYAWAGENLAMNNYGVAESPDRALVNLMNSPTHRANILANDFSRIGIGVVVHSDGRRFYSMIFIG